MIARIHVVRLDGSPVGWIHATLRNSVEALIAAGIYYYEIHAALSIPPADFAAALIEQREALMSTLIPAGTIQLLTKASLYYVRSEYVVMWMNKRKRAIHDYIAGTVVIHDPRQAILPWRRLKVMSDISDKIEEMSFEDFLEKHGKHKSSDNPS